MERPPIRRTLVRDSAWTDISSHSEKEPKSISGARHISNTFQEVVARSAPERIDHAISSIVRNQCCVRLGCLGSSSVALYLARAKGTLQPRESEAHPTATWVQVPRIGIGGARCCLPGLTDDICSTSSLR